RAGVGVRDGWQDLGAVRGRRRIEVHFRASGGKQHMTDMSADGHEATRVLVIDDEAPIRLLCRVNLEAEGMQVLEAADGPTGLDRARDDDPDVILLDVMIPGMDGWQVAEELLEDERTKRIPVVFLTARAEL